MATTQALTPTEMRILLRIVGSRPGADSPSIEAFVQSHRWPDASPEQVQGSIRRLVEAGLIVERGNKYHASQELQAAFINDCRNCRDTIEEFDVLARIIERRAK